MAADTARIKSLRDLLSSSWSGERLSLMKNVVVISVAFMIQFTAFQSMSALQSSINKAREKIVFVLLIGFFGGLLSWQFAMSEFSLVTCSFFKV